MKLQALASVAVLLCTGFVSAMPNQQWGDNCYKCEYKYDDCGKEYGGYDVSLPYIHPRSLPSMHIVFPPYLPSLPSCGITTNHQSTPNLPSPHFTPTPPQLPKPSFHLLSKPTTPTKLTTAIQRSYNSCYESFDQCYPKPYCKEDECHKCEYKNDNCGKKYGGYVFLQTPTSLPPYLPSLL